MSDGPYTEGWTLAGVGEDGNAEVVKGPKLPILASIEVVPFSDAERMREALGELIEAAGPFIVYARAKRNARLRKALGSARRALNPEQGK